ncbi:MAG: chlorite dismutase family protein [Cyanobacteria bacterium]|nr:chlorite dismutase family protein [Cyanobacteriota bacterium]
MPDISHLQIVGPDENQLIQNPTWILRGFTSNIRYTNHTEDVELKKQSAPLGRVEATHGAMIILKKSVAWWNLAQDERRRIFEEESKHIQIGMKFLPEVSRRLHHSRDLNEPFDFITWFEYAPEYENAFSDLADQLRATKEWQYIDREIDYRFIKSEQAR